MEAIDEPRTDAEVLDVIDAALDALTEPRLRIESDKDLVDLLDRAVTISNRVQAWQTLLAARVEREDAVWSVHGTSTRTWLAETRQMTPARASKLIHDGADLARFAQVADAATDGRILLAQAEAITATLNELDDDFDTDQVVRAEQMMVGFARTHHAAELRRLTHTLVEVIDPDGSERREACRLDAEHARAMRNRHLTFADDHHGSVLIRGSLPVAEAEPFRKMVDAHAAQVQRGFERIDPDQPRLTPGMRRADGLLAMVARHAEEVLAPSNGGDRPRIVVTIQHDDLLRMAHTAGITPPIDGTESRHGVGSGDGVPSGGGVGSAAGSWCPDVVGGTILATGQRLDVGTLRRLLCDADVLPIVMKGASQVLDIGQDERLVTPQMRIGLDARDAGCVFPGCDKPPEACHAHHIVPWWAGGPTALHNLVLVCPHHHGIVEPAREPDKDRWQIRLRESDGQPEVIPPRRVDPLQRPRQHARFTVAADPGPA